MDPEKKKAYEEKTRAQLREWNAKVEELLARADQAKAEGKIQFHERVEELRAKREVLRDELDELKDASEDAWEGVRQKVDRARKELKSAVEGAFASLGSEGEGGPAEPDREASRQGDTAERVESGVTSDTTR